MNKDELTQDIMTPTVGERIAETRRTRGLALETVAERTRIPVRHLQAIEESRHDALPAATYSIGFVKTYARLLGLDAEALASDFRAERGEMAAVKADYTPFEPADPSRVPPKLLGVVGLVTAILFSLIYMAWRGYGESDTWQQIAASKPAVQTPAAPKPAPAAAPTPTPAPPTDKDQVILTASGEDVWIKVSEKEGPTLFMGTLKAGDRYEVPIDATDPRLTTGRPQSLVANIGSRSIPSVDPRERTIRDVSLKATALLAYSEAIASSMKPAEKQPGTSDLRPRSAAGKDGETSTLSATSGNVASSPTP